MRSILPVLFGLMAAAPALGASGAGAPFGLVTPPPLIRALQRSEAGQYVVAVGLPGLPAAEVSTDFSPDTRLLPRLQSIGEACSTSAIHLIPWVVGSTWVLAPETREELVFPDRNASPLATMERASVLTCFLASLTPEQVKRLGSPAGLAAGDLRGTARAALASALRPPLVISERIEPVDPDQDGAVQKRWNDVRRLDRPLDLSRLRVFARLSVRSAYIRVGSDNYISLPVPPPSWPVLRGEMGANARICAVSLEVPRLPTVPNGYKPSDLSGRALRHPIGLAGVHTLKEVVAAASRATGLSLHVNPIWSGLPVYLGTKDIPSGDVMDALCLILEGAWRKLGSERAEYVLSWDRRGLAPLQQSMLEALDVVNNRAARLMKLASGSRAWVPLAQTLPFDEDNPLALTDEQRAILLPEGPGMDPRLGLETMDPSQQAWVREQAGDCQVTEYIENGESFERLLDSEEIETAAIDPNLDILLSIEEPSIGRLPLDPETGRIALGPLDSFRSNGMAEAKRILTTTPEMMNDPGALETTGDEEVEPEGGGDEASGDEDQKAPKHLDLPAIPSTVRAVMVGPLGPGMLHELAGTMRRHGFNTLFYPVLYDGYSTMPSVAFPLHPALRGKDGLEAALSAAGNGIRVVAYMNVLTWRGPDPSHWLRKHPEWLDRDLLGRTRTEWLGNGDVPELSLMFDTTYDRDYVRASEPAVAARLHALLNEVAARPGISGMAFCDWYPEPSAVSGACNGIQDLESQLPMGYALPDRYDFLRETGLDPVDLTLWSEPPFLPRTMALPREDLERWGMSESGSPLGEQELACRHGRTTYPAESLLSSLLRSTRALRPLWETYVFRKMTDYGGPAGPGGSGPACPNKPAGLVQPDHTIGPCIAAGERADGAWIPLATEQAARYFLRKDSLNELHGLVDLLRQGEWREFNLFGGGGVDESSFDPPHITVLNVQQSVPHFPSLIFDVLRLFRPPTPADLAAPKPKPGASS